MKQVKKSNFVISVTSLRDCPKEELPEYAFIGRSNVGKSSLINMLTNRKNLAKTSAKPGKTQTINYFRINDSWHLVDLPGYGWAKVSMEKKMAWSKFVRDYLLNRESLTCLFILIDIRLEPQAIDLEFIKWAGLNHIPIGLVFTKADKVSKQAGIKSVELFKKAMKQDWEKLPPIFISSAVSKQGQESLLEYIYSINDE